MSYAVGGIYCDLEINWPVAMKFKVAFISWFNLWINGFLADADEIRLQWGMFKDQP